MHPWLTDYKAMIKKLTEESYKTLAVKLVVVGIVMLASVAGGVYVGGALSDRNRSDLPTVVAADSGNHGGPPRLSLALGDTFPPEQVICNGLQTDFGNLVRDRDAIVLFTSTRCDPCLDLLRFWNSICVERVRDNVLQIVVLADSEKIPPEYVGLFSKVTVVYYRAEEWRTRYNQDFWPTIVGVDNSGFITHIQYGFEQTIDHELTRRFCDQFEI